MGISGGFLEADRVVSCVGHDVTSLCATHEEADTRIILHAIMQCHMVTTKLYSMLYINSMIVQVGNVVGGNVGHDTHPPLSCTSDSAIHVFKR